MTKQYVNQNSRRTFSVSTISFVASLSLFSVNVHAEEMRIYLDKSGHPFTKDSTLKIQNQNLERKLDSQGRYFFVYSPPPEKEKIDLESLAPKEREAQLISELKFPADPAPNTQFKTAHGQLESFMDENGKAYYHFQPLSWNPNQVSSASAMTPQEKADAEAKEFLQLQRAFLESQGVQMELQFGSPLETKYYFNGQAFYKFKGLPPISRDLTTYQIDQLSDHERAQFNKQPMPKITKRDPVRK